MMWNVLQQLNITRHVLCPTELIMQVNTRETRHILVAKHLSWSPCDSKGSVGAERSP